MPNSQRQLAFVIDLNRRKEESEIMDVLIVRRWQELLGSFTKDPSEVQA